MKVLIIKVLFFLYFLLKPFYFWKKPFQIADIILIVLFFVLLLIKRWKIPTFYVRSSYIYMIFYISFINIIWYIILEEKDMRFIYSNIYFIYNLIAILVIILMYKLLEKNFFSFFAKTIFLCNIVIIAATIIFNENGVRRSVGFNNPNQLAYYAICITTICCIWNKYLSKLQINILISSMVYLIMISLSKAAILAVFFNFC